MSEKTLHPVGTFNDTRIVDHGFDESKNGTLYFWARFETPEADEFGSLIGRFYLSDKAAEYTIEKIIAMGFTGETLKELADGTLLNGNLCQITVAAKNDEGYAPSVEVKFVNENYSTGGMTHDEEASLKAKNFDALFKSKLSKAADDAAPF